VLQSGILSWHNVLQEWAEQLGVHQFGKYEAVARLASGGAANVFLVRRENPLGNPPWQILCLKTLLEKRLEDDDFIAMFLDEAKLGQKLNHPSCVQVIEFGSIDGILFQAMEFVFGLNLWELLGSVPRLRRPLPRTAVAEILAKACRGLHFAHALKNEDGAPFNLIHRDISPQNIMITFDGAVKILDFGVASADTGRNATATGIVKGKFGYMSPEQISGGIVDARSDIYSMGIILFECLASRRLYKGQTPSEIAKLILKHRPPRLQTLIPKIHPELDRICAKALMADPKQRYQSAGDLASDLEGYLEEAKQRELFQSARNTVQKRFSKDYAARKASIEELARGDFDEAQLIESFGARPVMSLDFAPMIGKTEHDVISALRMPFLVQETATVESDSDDGNSTHSVANEPLDTIATRLGDEVVVNDEVTMNVPSVRARTVKPLVELIAEEEGVTQLEFVEPSAEYLEISASAPTEEDRDYRTRPANEEIRSQDNFGLQRRYSLAEVITLVLVGALAGFLLGVLVSRYLW